MEKVYYGATLNTLPVLYLICGKIAAGKSTLAQELASGPSTILISEDVWLSKLFPGEISGLEDYVRCSSRLRDAMGPHIQSLLSRGVSVVMDYPANTLKNRAWMRSIFEGAEVAHELHYLDIPDDICMARLKKRNEAGNHDFQTSEEEFKLISSYFETPSVDEGFNMILHKVK